MPRTAQTTEQVSDSTTTAAPAPETVADTLPAPKKKKKPAEGWSPERTLLTDQEVSDIRYMFHVDKMPVVEICALLDLPQSTVYTCARGSSYRHVPMPNGLLPGTIFTRRTKVSAETVAGIRAMSAERVGGVATGAKKYTQAEIARHFKVSSPYVRAVILGLFRADIPAGSSENLPAPHVGPVKRNRRSSNRESA